jgi:hypothetical protein
MNEIYKQWLDERPTFKKLRDWKTGLSPLVIKAHQTKGNVNKDNVNKGNISRVITGDAGVGKSCYAFKVGAKIHYDFNGYTKVDEEEYSYKFALDNMIYRPDDLFNRVKQQLDSDEQALFWIIDDGSVHMGRQLFDQDRESYRKLQGTVPTLRECVAGLFITTISVYLLAKPFREFIRKKVVIQRLAEASSYRCIAKHYEKWYYPDDVKFRMSIPFQDRFSCLVPEPFYSWYHNKKMAALKEYNESIIRKPIVYSGVEDIDER